MADTQEAIFNVHTWITGLPIEKKYQQGKQKFMIEK